jgi:hypothetical protein
VADAAASSVLLAAAESDEDGRCTLEALGFFPPEAAAAGRLHLMDRVRTIVPFLDESLAGEPLYRTGTAPRFSRPRLDRGQREERLAAGWRTSIFRHAPFTFLRNEDYASTGLAEGLLSGALALA